MEISTSVSSTGAGSTKIDRFLAVTHTVTYYSVCFRNVVEVRHDAYSFSKNAIRVFSIFSNLDFPLIALFNLLESSISKFEEVHFGAGGEHETFSDEKVLMNRRNVSFEAGNNSYCSKCKIFFPPGGRILWVS